MMHRSFLCLAAVLFATGMAAADDLKSGPQVGDGVPGGFRVLCANGTYAGSSRCPV